MRWALCLAGLCACSEGSVPPAPSASTTASAAPATAPRAGELVRAELTRRAGLVVDDDLKSRDVLVRRAATRALARIRGAGAHAGLLRALADEDAQVVAWAAYGLGDDCEGRRDETVRTLVAAALSRLSRAGEEPAPSALGAIARAVGRCAATESEASLIVWARRDGALGREAVHALGDVGTQKKKLREETIVALLNLAAGDASKKPRAEALYPLGRIEHLPPSVVERAREVAQARLADAGPSRLFAVRALGRCDDGAIAPLAEVLGDREHYAPAERAEAARALKRFGGPGQKALASTLERIAPRGGDDPVLLGPHFGAVLTALEMMDNVGKARDVLGRMVSLPAPEGAAAPLVRRISWLRCRAAQLLVEREYRDVRLRACDLSEAAPADAEALVTGSIGARAVVAAIGVDAVEIRGNRLRDWRRYASEGELRAREAAVALLGEHHEIDEAPSVLAAALASEHPGLAGTAAEVIAKHPERVQRKTKKRQGDPGIEVAPEIAAALVKALDAAPPAADVEALAMVIDATAALRLAPAREKLGPHCRSPWPELRKHAQQALVALGDAATRCEPPPEGLPAPRELDHLRSGKVVLKLDSDVGALALELDAAIAPLAVTRVADLAKQGYYDGMVVHRVVAGFVSQLGSPDADGYGGAPGTLPMPCETSPLAFAPWSVGVALAGRDTGSSQIFVTHADYPHLDGLYAWLGTATGPWDAFVDGDRIVRATVVE